MQVILSEREKERERESVFWLIAVAQQRIKFHLVLKCRRNWHPVQIKWSLLHDWVTFGKLFTVHVMNV
jgi:hypothetical protein